MEPQLIDLEIAEEDSASLDPDQPYDIVLDRLPPVRFEPEGFPPESLDALVAAGLVPGTETIRADVQHAKPRPGLNVPATSIIATDDRLCVYRDTGQTRYEPVEVEIVDSEPGTSTDLDRLRPRERPRQSALGPGVTGLSLVADRVGMTFGARAVLHDVSVGFDSGRSYALVGPSGSGKSTFLAIMGGLLEPSTGRVLVDDVAVDSGELRMMTGWVHQSTNLLKSRSVWDNIDMASGLVEHDREARQRRTAALREAVGLNDRARQSAGLLSGGESQRVGIPRDIALRAPIVLADEPTGNLDGRTTGEVMDHLLNLANTESCVLVVVTHDPAVASRCSMQIELGTLNTAGEARRG